MFTAVRRIAEVPMETIDGSLLLEGAPYWHLESDGALFDVTEEVFENEYASVSTVVEDMPVTVAPGSETVRALDMLVFMRFNRTTGRWVLKRGDRE